jgi:hypothetical protein
VGGVGREYWYGSRELVRVLWGCWSQVAGVRHGAVGTGYPGSGGLNKY